MMWFKKIICKIFGHEFLYPVDKNLKPEKPYCKRCGFEIPENKIDLNN